MGKIEDALEEGKINARAIIEILGKPKAHVEETLKQLMAKIKEEDEIEIVKENIEPAAEQGKMFSTFAEVEFLAKNIQALTGFCFDYMPSSIEILAPDSITFKNIDVSNFLNDLQAKLHGVEMVLKQMRSENQFLKKNTNTILRNLIATVLHNGPKDAKTIAKVTGIIEEELNKFLELLVKLEVIEEKDGVYSLKKKK